MQFSTFFGDLADNVMRVELQKGYTMLIPAGRLSVHYGQRVNVSNTFDGEMHCNHNLSFSTSLGYPDNKMYGFPVSLCNAVYKYAPTVCHRGYL